MTFMKIGQLVTILLIPVWFIVLLFFLGDLFSERKWVLQKSKKRLFNFFTYAVAACWAAFFQPAFWQLMLGISPVILLICYTDDLIKQKAWAEEADKAWAEEEKNKAKKQKRKAKKQIIQTEKEQETALRKEEESNAGKLKALEELESGNLDKLTWANALIAAEGDETKAKAEYLKLRK